MTLVSHLSPLFFFFFPPPLFSLSMKNPTTFLFQVCFTAFVAHTLLNTHAGAAVTAARRSKSLHRTRSFPSAFCRRASPASFTRVSVSPTSSHDSNGRGRNKYLFYRGLRRHNSSDPLHNSILLHRTTKRRPTRAFLRPQFTTPAASHQKRVVPSRKPEQFVRADVPKRPFTPIDKIMPATARTPLTAESIDHVLSSSNMASTYRKDKEHDTEPVRQSLDSTRPSRSASSTSRNRLSLTLPIAPPNGISARPTPTSAINGSFPPTPAELRLSSSLASPSEPADLLRSIAAQEQKVLELKDELKHAEYELRKMRKAYQYHAQKSHKHSSHFPAAASDADASDEAVAQKRAVELDRRRAVLAAQQQHQQGRRVFRGQHARALSLVSPTKSTTSEFEDMTDDSQDSVSTASISTAPTFTAKIGPNRSTLHNRNHSILSKRATWNVGTKHSTGIKQFADDFRTGLWTFVEDIRQVTVGEDATAVRSANIEPMPRPGRSTAIETKDGSDTIRASSNTRPKASNLFDEIDTSSVSQRPKATRQDSKNKRFSYTLLTEDLNDDDWSNWDSPTIGVPSPRWSGSTMANSDSTSSARTEELISVADGSSATPRYICPSTSSSEAPRPYSYPSIFHISSYPPYCY